MQLSASIFKAYDIRGIVPSTLDTAVAEGLGKAFGSAARAAAEEAEAAAVVEEAEAAAVVAEAEEAEAAAPAAEEAAPAAEEAAAAVTLRAYQAPRCRPRSCARRRGPAR